MNAVLSRKRSEFLRYWCLNVLCSDLYLIDARVEELIEIERLLAMLWTRLMLDVKHTGEWRDTSRLTRQWLKDVMIPQIQASTTVDRGDNEE